MATTITITCPKCNNQSKGPEALEGKTIRCKSCGNTFAVQAARDKKSDAPAVNKAAKNGPGAPAKTGGGKSTTTKPKAAAKRKADPDDEEDPNPYVVTDTDLAPRCPFCAKEIEEDAVICIHCGYNTRTRTMTSTRKTYETTGGDRFWWLLPGIACALTVVALIGFIVFVWIAYPKFADETKDEWYTVFFGLAFKLWESIVALFAAFYAGMFAVKRLILHPTPPEKIKMK